MARIEKIEVVIFDADGVIIKPTGYFSDKLVKEHGINKVSVDNFFRTEFNACLLGRADLKRKISKYVPIWKWTGSVKELLECWFSGEREVDENVLAIVQKLRASDIKCYLASAQEQYRAHYIMKDMELERYFDNCFFSCNLGYHKTDIQFWEKIIAKAELSPKAIMLWDDTQENVNTAKEIGIDAHLYTDFKSFEQTMMEKRLIKD
mgnify:CR=1 FL=1